MVGMTSLANPRVAGNGGDTDAEVCNGRETLDPQIRRTLLEADSTRLLRACSGCGAWVFSAGTNIQTHSLMRAVNRATGPQFMVFRESISKRRF